LWLEAWRELGSPVLPLRVGNRWVYAQAWQGPSGAAVYSAAADRSERFELEVVGTRDFDGLHAFILAVGPPGEASRYDVAAVGGELRVVEADGTLGRSVISL